MASKDNTEQEPVQKQSLLKKFGKWFLLLVLVIAGFFLGIYLHIFDSDEMNKKLVNLESLYASAIDTKLWLKPILIFLRKNVHSSGEELLKALKSYSFDSQLYLLYKEKYYDNNLSSKSYKIVKNGSLFDIFNDN